MKLVWYDTDHKTILKTEEVRDDFIPNDGGWWRRDENTICKFKYSGWNITELEDRDKEERKEWSKKWYNSSSKESKIFTDYITLQNKISKDEFADCLKWKSCTAKSNGRLYEDVRITRLLGNHKIDNVGEFGRISIDNNGLAKFYLKDNDTDKPNFTIIGGIVD